MTSPQATPSPSSRDSLYPTPSKYLTPRLEHPQHHFMSSLVSRGRSEDSAFEDWAYSILPAQCLALWPAQVFPDPSKEGETSYPAEINNNSVIPVNDKVLPPGWHCRRCGMLNVQNYLRMRKCTSVCCKDADTGELRGFARGLRDLLRLDKTESSAGKRELDEVFGPGIYLSSKENNVWCFQDKTEQPSCDIRHYLTRGPEDDDYETCEKLLRDLQTSVPLMLNSVPSTSKPRRDQTLDGLFSFTWNASEDGQELPSYLRKVEQYMRKSSSNSTSVLSSVHCEFWVGKPLSAPSEVTQF